MYKLEYEIETNVFLKEGFPSYYVLRLNMFQKNGQ